MTGYLKPSFSVSVGGKVYADGWSRIFDSRRRIFNRVKEHLLKQGKKSMRRGACAYRGDGGMSCAVGCLISDDAYDAALEGYLTDSDDILKALSKSGVPVDREMTSMLRNLQGIHDKMYPEVWAVELDSLEKELFG